MSNVAALLAKLRGLVAALEQLDGNAKVKCYLVDDTGDTKLFEGEPAFDCSLLAGDKSMISPTLGDEYSEPATYEDIGEESTIPDGHLVIVASPRSVKK